VPFCFRQTTDQPGTGVIFLSPGAPKRLISSHAGMQAHAGRCGPVAAGPRGSGPTPPARRCHSRPALGKAPPALSLRSSDVVWETAATPSGPFCAWPRTHAPPASLTRTAPAGAEASRRSLAAGVAHAWASFKDQARSSPGLFAEESCAAPGSAWRPANKHGCYGFRTLDGCSWCARMVV